MLIEIDEGSGFCFGVTTAIKKAEEELAKSDSLYCLGDIVHNGREVERLKRMGLMTVEHSDLQSLHDIKMLLRAHGPGVYLPLFYLYPASLPFLIVPYLSRIRLVSESCFVSWSSLAPR